MSDFKVNLVNEEEPSRAEKEQKVLENAGIDVDADNGAFKVDLSQPPKTETDAVQEQSTDEVPVQDEPEASQEMVEEVRDTEEPTEQKEEPLELIKEETDGVQVQEQGSLQEEQTQSEEKQEVVQEQTTVELPDNIHKLVEFMKETGGSVEDYVRLNTDYSTIDDQTLLREYYKQTKPHLENDEIDFLMEDTFSYDEDIDEEREIKRKKLAYKEEVVKAKSFLNDLKGKYYDEIKMNTNLPPEQKEAVEFYNQYKKQQDELTAKQQKAAEEFTKKTESFFNEEFKGFEFKVGESKYRLKVNDTASVKEVQSNIVKSFEKFLSEDGVLSDAQGYHKALFAARNADTIANHFYEQGKADAIKQLEAESKNINMNPRKTQEGFVDAGGLKVRAVSGDNSSKLRVKIKQ
jgi:hypothetical protein